MKIEKLTYADGEHYDGDWSHVQNAPKGNIAKEME